MQYSKQLNRALGMAFARYRGCILKREDDHWICLGEKCTTLKDCDDLINKAGNSISKSIIKQDEHPKKDNNQEPLQP
jgi:hypothetical protein